MTTDEGRVRRIVRAGTAWLALLSIDVVGLLPWGRIRFPVSDFAEMVYEIRRIELGFVPYRDTVTHHYLGYVVPFVALGSLVDWTPWLLKSAAVFFHFLTAVFVWLALREVRGPRTAWLGAFLAVTLGWFWSWQGFGFNVQSLLAPVIASLIFFVIRACARASATALSMAALSSGILLTWDPRTLAFLPLLVIPAMVVPAWRRWRAIALAASTLLLPPFCAAAYLLRAGAWRDFVEQTFVYPLAYRNHGVTFDVAAFVRTWLGTWLGGELLAVPLMVAGLAAVLRVDARAWLKAVCVIAIGSALVYAIAGGRPYPNYFMVFAPILLILIAQLPELAGRARPDLARVLAAALVALGVFCGLRPLLLWQSTGSIFLTPNEATIEAAAAYLRANTTREDKVLVWGYSPGIYVLADRFHTFRDEGLLSIAGANFASSAAGELVDEFETFVTHDPPKVIVVYNVKKEPCPGKGIIQRNFDYQRNTALARLRDTLASAYEPGPTMEGACDSAAIFVRRVTTAR